MGTGLYSIQQRAKNSFKRRAGDTHTIDPATIVAIAELVAEIVVIIQENCADEPQQALKISRSPSFLQRRVLSYKTFRMLGFRGYAKYGKDMVESILEAGRNSSVSEIEQAFMEV